MTAEAPLVAESPPTIAESARRVSDVYGADIYLYSGPIDDGGYGQVASEIARTKQQAEDGRITGHNTAILILTTTGGQANPEYQIARLFQTQYTEFVIFTPSYCKSAGTIIALGAHKLLMDVFSELGPLDVQLLKENEILSRRSGLLLRSSFESLQEVSFDLFQHLMLSITLASEGQVGFKVASELSATMTSNLLSPVYSQINPDVMGSDYRDLNVALHYGFRLAGVSGNISSGGVRHLVEHYPSHDFIIDSQEAGTIFENVAEPLPELYDLLGLLGEIAYVEQERTVVRSLSTMVDDDENGGIEDERTDDAGKATPDEAPSVDACGDTNRQSHSEPDGDGKGHADDRPT